MTRQETRVPPYHTGPPISHEAPYFARVPLHHSGTPVSLGAPYITRGLCITWNACITQGASYHTGPPINILRSTLIIWSPWSISKGITYRTSHGSPYIPRVGGHARTPHENEKKKKKKAGRDGKGDRRRNETVTAVRTVPATFLGTDNMEWIIWNRRKRQKKK